MRAALFNKLAIGEMKVSFLTVPTSISAKAAFVNTESGDTHGWTESARWSAEVFKKLEELRALMEKDLEQLHFADAEGTTTSSGGPQLPPNGLGEAMGAIPQV